MGPGKIPGPTLRNREPSGLGYRTETIFLDET
jgi:hypothetical protein